MKKKILIMVLVVLTGIAGVYGYKVYKDVKELKQTEAVHAEVKQIISDTSNEESSDSTPAFSSEAWQKLHDINDDFVGYLRFTSGLIEQPIVQGDSNDEYLRVAFTDNQYNSQGTPFMETNCSVNSDNITIYGHHVFYTDDAMFTPLMKLLDQSDYEQNKIVEFYLEDEIRTYQIAYVYVIDCASEDYYYWQPDFFDEEEFNDYLVYPAEHNAIQSDVTDIAYGDHILTLQTCYTLNTEERLIVVAKEISREAY